MKKIQGVQYHLMVEWFVTGVALLAVAIATVLIPILYRKLYCDEPLCSKCRYPQQHTGNICPECGTDVAVFGLYQPKYKLRWLFVLHLLSFPLAMFAVGSAVFLHSPDYLADRILRTWKYKYAFPYSESYEKVDVLSVTKEISTKSAYSVPPIKGTQKQFTIILTTLDGTEHSLKLTRGSSVTEKIEDWFELLQLHDDEQDMKNETHLLGLVVEHQFQWDKIRENSKAYAYRGISWGQPKAKNVSVQHRRTAVKDILAIVSVLGMIYAIVKYSRRRLA